MEKDSFRSDGSKADISIIPVPSELKKHDGYFEFSGETKIYTETGNDGAKYVGNYLAGIINPAGGINLAVEECLSPPAHGKYVWLTTAGAEKNLDHEGYRLSVDKNTITIAATSQAGLFYGVQTIRQLLPAEIEARENIRNTIPLKIPCVTILDTPRYSWRGMHLDVSRHFFTKDFIKKYLDIMAMHKMNTFHWHLVDGAGWRIEIEQYPRLTEVGAWREDRSGQPWDFTKISAHEPDSGTRPYGGFYSKEDIREIVEYAHTLSITVVPEIEMPGHSHAVLAGYPEYLCTNAEKTNREYGTTGVFCAGKEKTFEFLENILDEVIGLFPGQYIHIGGDEVPKRFWKACPDCQARINSEDLKDEGELQSYFIRRIERFLTTRDRKLIGWDEILEGGLAPEAVVMSWRGMKGGTEAAHQLHDVIMTPESTCYFNHYQGDPEREPKAWGGFTPLHQVYAFEPTPPELTQEEAQHIIGAQACVWTEFIETPELIEYMILPRISALAEVVWSTPDRRNWEDFKGRMIKQYRRFDHMNLCYAKSAYNVSFDVSVGPPGFEAVVKMTTDTAGTQLRYTSDGSDPSTESLLYEKPIMLIKTARIKAASYIQGKQTGEISTVEYHRHKASGKLPVLGSKYSDGYPGSGDYTLTNCLKGSKDYSDGEWQGFIGQDLVAVIDLGAGTEVSRLSSTYFHNAGVWIFMPSKVEYSVSDDGVNFEIAAVLNNETPQTKEGPYIKEFSCSFEGISARYIKVVAKNLGVCPEWHAGAGSAAWLFADEIVVE